MINPELMKRLEDDEIEVPIQINKNLKKVREEWGHPIVTKKGRTKVYRFKVNIIPRRAMYMFEYREIIWIHDKYIIKDVFIHTDPNNIIKEIYLGPRQKHVNCDPKTNMLCLPDNIKDNDINEPSLLWKLKYLLTTYRMDSRYFVVPDHEITAPPNT